MVITLFRVTGAGDRTRLTAFFSHFYMSSEHDKILWRQITDRVASEYAALPADEKSWIASHAGTIISLQNQLHQLFLDVGGERICRDCDGDCCGHGKFHPNLANLLAFLSRERSLPEPDFELGCPYIGQQGCQFPPALRPYNCISFICGQIENGLTPANRGEFYRLEKKIRSEYALFVERYIGAGMNGIMIKGEILPSYLTRR